MHEPHSSEAPWVVVRVFVIAVVRVSRLEYRDTKSFNFLYVVDERALLGRLEFLVDLLISPLEIYTLIKAWDQVKFSLFDLFAFLTFGAIYANKVKRP